jgi:anti-sigma B factor antagonist
LETAIGVFSSREKAEEAMQELLKEQVPKDSIIFLTLSEAEAKIIGKEFGATVGGFAGAATGVTAGVLAATLLMVPGVGQVFALGFGAAALFGLAGAGAGSALGGATVEKPLPDSSASHREDAEFFREVLQSGRSLIVVRTESQDIAKQASSTLDRLGLGIHGHTPTRMHATTRNVHDITIIDVSGRITAGEGNVVLRDTVRRVIENGSKKILMNLHEVGYIDSSGMGELVKSYTSVRNQGGQLKLVSLSKRVSDLLQLTRLNAVFDIEQDEASAIQSF